MQTIFPFVHYRDKPAAVEWLVRAFGFQKQNTEVDHLPRVGSGVILLSSPTGGDELRTKTVQHPPLANQGFYVLVSNPSAHCLRAKAAGAEIVRELGPGEYEWVPGVQYLARDVEGHLWGFGERVPGQGVFGSESWIL